MSNNAEANVPEVTLGWRLRMSMEKAGIKADDMGVRLHVHRGTITRWTHDIGSPPRGVYLERWAEITGVPLAWLAQDVAMSRSRVSSPSNRGCVTTTRRPAPSLALSCDRAAA